jgi:predicted nucleotidyltransferase component of viral defense system
MKNRAASLRARLLHLSKKENIEFQVLISRFLHERLLYRISVSDFSNHFVLKGGAFMYAIQGLKTRPTTDVDFLGQQIANDVDALCDTFRKICSTESSDEVHFLPESIQGEPIAEQEKYNGVRVFVDTQFDTIRQRLQIDIGFGDVVTPENQQLEYPILLDDLEIPVVRAYSVETVIAEKFQAMIELSLFNSRMKDFYDIYKLLASENYNSDLLQEAIISTFKNRETFYIHEHSLFSPAFATDSLRKQNWAAFLRKIKRDKELTFEEVMQTITTKLKPYWEVLNDK